MTREDQLAIGLAFTIAAGVLVWGWSAGAFAGNKGTPGAVPKPQPMPDLPGPPPTHADPLAGVEEADVPPEILAGGVPVENGWETFAWYSYRGLWLRVDVRPDVDSGPGHEHGLYRWVVIGGEATPLASWTTESLPEFSQIVAFEDENTDWIAGRAAEWVDELLAAGGS